MSSAIAQGHRFMPMVIIVGLTLMYALSGLFSPGMGVSGQATPPALFFPAGIALAAGLRFGPRVWPGVLLGQLLLGHLSDVNLPASAAMACINSAGIVIGVRLFRRLKGRRSLLSIRDLSILLCLILFVLQPFSATASMLALHWLEPGIVAASSRFWLDWWFSNALAQVIVTPLLLSLIFQRKDDHWPSIELVPLGIVLVLLCWLVLMELPFISPALPFAVFTPLLMIIALRYGIGPGSAATLLVACMTLLSEHLVLGQYGQTSSIALADLNIFLLGIVPAVQAIAILSRQQLRSMDTLSNLQQRYQRVFEQAPALVNAFDQHGRCIIWSDECARVFGYTRESILSHPDPITLFYPDPAVRDRVLKPSRSLTDRSGFVEWHPLRHDGTALSTLWASVPISEDLTVNIGIDITERKQAEARLRIAASVFEHSYDGIVIISPEKTIVDINPAGTQLLGYDAKDLLGTPLESYRPKNYSDKFYESLWRSVDMEDSWQGEVVMRHRTGGRRPLRTTVFTVRDLDHSILRYIIVFTDISELKAKEAQLQRMAHYDSLTGLPNRYLLNDRLCQAMANAERSNTLMAVCYLDLDGFKQINDDMGHDAGDAVLIEVARRIQAILRRKDTVARLGGDEMALLLTNLAHPDDSREVLDRVLSSVSEPILLGQDNAQISASIGVSFFHLDGASFDVLLSKADTAMYQAKRSGKNRYYFYTSSDHTGSVTAG